MAAVERGSVVVCAFVIGGCGIYAISMQKKERKNEEHWENSGEITGEFIFIRVATLKC